MFHMWMRVSAVADAWRALKSPSLGESSLEGAVSGLSTTSPSEGLSAPGTLGDTPHFNTLAGGALGAHNGKYSRWVTGWVSSETQTKVFGRTILSNLPINVRMLFIWLARCSAFKVNIPKSFRFVYSFIPFFLYVVENFLLIAPCYWSTSSSRLEGQAGTLVKESVQRETSSLCAGSDCASTRGMAGSIISSYTLPDRWHSCILLWSLMSTEQAVASWSATLSNLNWWR